MGLERTSRGIGCERDKAARPRTAFTEFFRGLTKVPPLVGLPGVPLVERDNRLGGPLGGIPRLGREGGTGSVRRGDDSARSLTGTERGRVVALGGTAGRCFLAAVGFVVETSSTSNVRNALNCFESLLHKSTKGLLVTGIPRFPAS